MLRHEGMKPSTWIQAILLSDTVGEKIEAGGVYIPTKKKKRTGSLMFGDDTETDTEPSIVKSKWSVRAKNGDYLPGSTLVLRISRPVIKDTLMYIRQKHSKLAPYIKAILRKHIRKLNTGPNEPPEPEAIQDIFVIYESWFRDKGYVQINKQSYQQKREKKNTKETPEHTSSQRTKDMPKEKTQKTTESETQTPPKPKNPLLQYIG